MDSTLALWRRAAAEGLAAFALVFAGCGAIVANQQYHGGLGAVGAVGVCAFVRPPAVVSGEWQDFWIYVAGPLLGAALAAFAYQLVRGQHPMPPGGEHYSHPEAPERTPRPR